MASDKPVLEISNLHAGIDDTPILRGINLEIPAGEIHAIMGRNGSGKTTLFNIISGFLSPSLAATVISLESFEKTAALCLSAFPFLCFIPAQ